MEEKYEKEISTINPLIFHQRMPHIFDLILKQLDNKSLKNCKEVSKPWNVNFDKKKLCWIRIVSIPKILQNGNTYLHISASTGQSKMSEKLLENEDIKDPKNDYKETPFFLACSNGHLNVAELIMQKSAEHNIDLNTIDDTDMTPFHFACRKRHFNVVEFLIQKSAEYNIDLNFKHSFGWTAFHFACIEGRSKTVRMLLEKSLEYDIDINAKDIFGRTAFHMACWNDNSKIVEMLIQKSVDLNIELNAKDEDGKTAFDFAFQDLKLYIMNLMCKYSKEYFKFNLDKGE